MSVEPPGAANTVATAPFGAVSVAVSWPTFGWAAVTVNPTVTAERPAPFEPAGTAKVIDRPVALLSGTIELLVTVRLIDCEESTQSPMPSPSVSEKPSSGTPSQSWSTPSQNSVAPG